METMKKEHLLNKKNKKTTWMPDFLSQDCDGENYTNIF